MAGLCYFGLPDSPMIWWDDQYDRDNQEALEAQEALVRKDERMTGPERKLLLALARTVIAGKPGNGEVLAELADRVAEDDGIEGRKADGLSDSVDGEWPVATEPAPRPEVESE